MQYKGAVLSNEITYKSSESELVRRFVGINQKHMVYHLVPLVVLIILLTLFIIWLLIPGNRLFPSGIGQILNNEKLLEITVEENAALIQRKRQLESAIENAVCEADGTLTLPDGRNPFGVLPELKGDSTSPNQQSIPNSILPSAPGNYVVPPNTATQPGANLDETQRMTLVELIKNTTVLIINAGGEATGSGFFVSPNQIVTNDHVVDGHNGQLFVVGPSLNGINLARLIGTSGPFETNGDDFALLELDDVNSQYLNLRIPDSSIQLDNVFAAGFPGDYLESEIAFNEFLSGESFNIPNDVFITVGTVNGEPSISRGVDVIMHSASISVGNSGGPLLDSCGNLVGVNTFVRTDDIRTINFALPTERLVRFLRRNSATTGPIVSRCSPEISESTASVEENSGTAENSDALEAK